MQHVNVETQLLVRQIISEAKVFQSKSCECLEQTDCISCGGDHREYFQEEIGRMDGCGIISPVLLIHYCYKLQVIRSRPIQAILHISDDSRSACLRAFLRVCYDREHS